MCWQLKHALSYVEGKVVRQKRHSALAVARRPASWVRCDRVAVGEAGVALVECREALLMFRLLAVDGQAAVAVAVFEPVVRWVVKQSSVGS